MALTPGNYNQPLTTIGKGGYVNSQGIYVNPGYTGYQPTSGNTSSTPAAPAAPAAPAIPAVSSVGTSKATAPASASAANTTTAPQTGSPSLQNIVPTAPPSSTQPQPPATGASATAPGSPEAAQAQQAADMAKYFPQIHQALSSSGTAAPYSSGVARSAISEATAVTPITPIDPTTAAVNSASVQVLSDIAQRNNAEATMKSVQDFTNQSASELGIPQMKTDLMNIQNVMNGTDNDVRTEITAAGGFATESQIEGIVAGRNKVLLLKASNIQNALSNAQDNLNMQVSAYGADRANTLNALNDKVNGDQTALSLFQNIQSNAVSSYDKMFTAGGWNAIASLDANGKSLYEQTHGIPAGSLSDPAWVNAQQALLYKQQGQALAYQRAALGVDRYQASIGNVPTDSLGGMGTNGGGVMNGTIGTGITHVLPGDLNPTAVVTNSGGMTVGAVRLAATQFLANGVNSVTNKFGKAVVANEASVIQTELGLSDSDVVTMRESYGADLKSLTNIQTNADAAQASETKTNLNLKLAQSLSATVPRTGSPLANNYDLWAKGQLKGDVATVKFETAVYTAATEYAKVVGGSPGGGGSLTDSARAEADKLLSASYNQDQFDGVVGIMQQDMSNTISSYGSQIQDIKSRTLGGGATPTGNIQSQAAAKGYDYQGMINAGYNDEQIQQFLSQN